MALKGKFDQAAFEKRVQEAFERHRQNVIEALIWMGAECVKDAKSNGSYTDRTGNLRNSIGFVIFENGAILHEYFEDTAKGEMKVWDGSIEQIDPLKTGRDLAISVGSDYQGMALVVVAGMKYAICVEAKGYNVLTSAELLANTELPKLFEALR